MDSPGMPSPSIVLVLFVPVAFGLAVAAWLWYSGTIRDVPLDVVHRRLGSHALILATTGLVVGALVALRHRPGDEGRAVLYAGGWWAMALLVLGVRALEAWRRARRR